jgi:hypothetical protein
MIMIKISILYPNDEGSHFDLSHYLDNHMPMAIKLLGAHSGYQGFQLNVGLGAFMSHGAQLQGDIPNYTDVQPVIQLCEVLISRQ